ncbi:MAG: GTP cyclohydrolase I, partial [Gemmatimonadaceae bacterium]
MSRHTNERPFSPLSQDENIDAFDPVSLRLDEYAALVRRQLELIGEDPNRGGLVRTPTRVASSMEWLTRGYDLDVKQVVGEGIFEEQHDNMVMVRDIELYSLCEH